MKCNYCDYKVSEDTVYCPNCGENVHTTKKNPIKDQVSNKKTVEKDINFNIDIEKFYIIFGIIGFFIPIVGLVLFLSWKSTYEKCSKAAGIGALIKILFYLAIFLLSFIANTL